MRSCAQIPVVDDDDLEQEENFTITVTTDDPDITVSPPTGIVTIIDNDGVLLDVRIFFSQFSADDCLLTVCL